LQRSGGLLFEASQAKKKKKTQVCKAPYQQKKAGCDSVCLSPQLKWDYKIEGSQARLTWAKSKTQSPKYRTEGVVQAAKFLPKHKSLSSNSSINTHQKKLNVVAHACNPN
jgi:hypothetical protein